LFICGGESVIIENGEVTFKSKADISFDSGTDREEVEIY
jgi:hypothetical protein